MNEFNERYRTTALFKISHSKNFRKSSHNASELPDQSHKAPGEVVLHGGTRLLLTGRRAVIALYGRIIVAYIMHLM